jgi:hypothetical protein
VALLDRGKTSLEVFGLAMRVRMRIAILENGELSEIRRIDGVGGERKRSRRSSA